MQTVHENEENVSLMEKPSLCPAKSMRVKIAHKIAALLVLPFHTVLKRFEQDDTTINSTLGIITLEVHKLLESKIYLPKWTLLREFHNTLEASDTLDAIISETFQGIPKIFPVEEVSLILSDAEGKSTLYVQSPTAERDLIKNPVPHIAVSQERILRYLNEQAGEHAMKIPLLYKSQLIGILHLRGKPSFLLPLPETEDGHMAYEIAEHLAHRIYYIQNQKQLIDVNEQLQAANQELQALRITDPMDIYNKKYFEEKLREMVQEITRNADRSFSLLFMDMNDFKTINDSKGHLVGDEVLRQIAQTIKKNIRDEDIAFRWGGDEFVILVKGKSEAAQEVLQRIAPDLVAMGISWSTGICGVSNNHQIQLFSRDTIARVVAQITKLADEHMFLAKNEHKAKKLKDPNYKSVHHFSATHYDIFNIIQQETGEKE